MIPEAFFIANLKLVEPYALSDGAVVECGVWRGGMIGGMATLLGTRRSYVLFDSFEGLPPVREVDGPAAARWQASTDSSDYFDNCAAPETFAREAMGRAHVAEPILIKGWFDKTVPNFQAPGPIDVLRLDGDWYDSTMTCLQGLYDQVRPGGIIIIDDYMQWDGCARALHDFLSERSARERICSLEGVYHLHKQAPR